MSSIFQGRSRIVTIPTRIGPDFCPAYSTTGRLGNDAAL